MITLALAEPRLPHNPHAADTIISDPLSHPAIHYRQLHADRSICFGYRIFGLNAACRKNLGGTAAATDTDHRGVSRAHRTGWAETPHPRSDCCRRGWWRGGGESEGGWKNVGAGAHFFDSDVSYVRVFSYVQASSHAPWHAWTSGSESVAVFSFEQMPGRDLPVSRPLPNGGIVLRELIDVC